jgi:hypothetical protein
MKNKIIIRQDHWGVALSVSREVYLGERWFIADVHQITSIKYEK